MHSEAEMRKARRRAGKAVKSSDNRKPELKAASNRARMQRLRSLLMAEYAWIVGARAVADALREAKSFREAKG